MNENLILVAIFVAVLIVTFAVLRFAQYRRDVSQRLAAGGSSNKMSETEIDELLGSGNKRLRYYMTVVNNESDTSIRMRLVQAGFLSPQAVWWFVAIRAIISLSVLLGFQYMFARFFPTFSTPLAVTISLGLASVVFILCAAVVEQIAKRRLREFKKLFPDLMDLLLVCIDAGLSIEAAIDRVTREFLQTVPDFGVQLSIVELEIRAGRPLHEALTNLSRRIKLDEMRILAVLFRQSEELGASVSKTLRSFAKEMRQLRIVRAEEKANSLPVKMLFPMALFMFPVSLVIVLVPIMMLILQTLDQLGPK